MAYVDIDLREFDTRDLIDELENRYLDEREQKNLSDLLKNDAGKKMSLFLKIMDRFSLMQLEELFSEKCPDTPVPKEQLSLPLNL